MPVRRGARDNTGAIVAPITLGNMRENGTRSVDAGVPELQAHGRRERRLARQGLCPRRGLKLRCSAVRHARGLSTTATASHGSRKGQGSAGRCSSATSDDRDPGRVTAGRAFATIRAYGRLHPRRGRARIAEPRVDRPRLVHLKNRMHLTRDEIQAVVRAGGGVSLDVEGFFANDLVILARVARMSGAQLTLVGADRFSVDEVVMIVKEAPGHVFIVPRPEPSAPTSPVIPLHRRTLWSWLRHLTSPSQLVRWPTHRAEKLPPGPPC